MEQLNENTLDPIQETYNPKIFNKDGKMLPSVKKIVLDKIYHWLKRVGYKEDDLKQCYLIGSNSGYQYSKDSDLDISLGTTVSESDLKKLWSILPNGSLLPDTGHEINYYLLSVEENEKHTELASSAYDILNDKWIKEENKEELKKRFPFWYIMEVSKFFVNGCRERLNELNSDKIELEYLKSLNAKEEGISEEEIKERIARKEEEILADYDSVFIAHTMLKAFRKIPFENEDKKDLDNLLQIEVKTANNSINNMLYKVVEKTGLMKELEKAEKEREAIK